MAVISDYTNTGKVAPNGQTSLLGTAGTTPIYLLENQPEKKSIFKNK